MFNESSVFLEPGCRKEKNMQKYLLHFSIERILPTPVDNV